MQIQTKLQPLFQILHFATFAHLDWSTAGSVQVGWSACCSTHLHLQGGFPLFECMSSPPSPCQTKSACWWFYRKLFHLSGVEALFPAWAPSLASLGRGALHQAFGFSFRHTYILHKLTKKLIDTFRLHEPEDPDDVPLRERKCYNHVSVQRFCNSEWQTH